MSLRPYQHEAATSVHAAWESGAQTVCLVSPTGSGKTRTLAHIVHHKHVPTVVMAHRQEIVSQLSVALAGEGVMHNVIGPKALVKLCIKLHMEELGRPYISPSAATTVASVQTLGARAGKLKEWAKRIRMVVGDEFHHYTRGNQFGKAFAMFPNARGLGVTATPVRSDGKGLGRHADGFVDALVEGPAMRWLIKEGYLTDYRVYAPPSNLDLSSVAVSAATGDYSRNALVDATRKSHILGDVVAHYQRIAAGKRALVYAVDVESAKELSAQFGPTAVELDGKTPDEARVQALRKFKAGEYEVVTSVDLFDEGTDIPAVEVVVFARATQSYGRYVQMFGRGLRPVYAPGYDLSTREGRLAAIAAGGKPYAIVIDHVGNVLRHGLPDAPRKWSLDRREKRSRGDGPDDVIPTRACVQCLAVYERIHVACPYCGHEPVPAERSRPEQVDGDLTELLPEVLAAMRGEVADVDTSLEEARQDAERRHMPELGVRAHVKRHRLRQEAQSPLREAIAQWAGAGRAEGYSDRELYRRFFHTFGIDVLSAQALGVNDATALRERIEGV